MKKAEVIALTLLSVGETMHSFSSFLPSYFTIKNFALDGNEQEIDQKVADLRSGYIPAVSVGAIIAGAVAVVAHSPLPLIASGLSAVYMISQYEMALPRERRIIALPFNGQEAPTLEGG